MRTKQGTVVATLFVVFCLILIGSLPAPAQQKGPVPQVIHEIKHDTSRPLREMAAAATPSPNFQRIIPLRQPHPAQPQGLVPEQPDLVVQEFAGPLVGTTGLLNFEGIAADGVAPPDTNGSVGATQFVQIVNVEYTVYDKTTSALLLGPTAINAIWSGFGGLCQTNNNGDPIVLYDKAAGRWLVSQLAFNSSFTSNLQCIAVSTTSDATGSYNRYSFSFGGNLNDYPKFGVWPDAYYFSANMFAGAVLFIGPQACAFDRTAMLAGNAATSVCFQLGTSDGGLLPSDLDGSTPPPAGSPNFFLEFVTNSLNLFKFHVDFVAPGNSTFTGPTNIPVAAFTQACNGGTCIPQSGTTQNLDSLGDRLMYRLAYRNFGDHESLVVNHSVKAGTTSNQTGVRWYELRAPNGTPTVFQQSTFAPDSNYRWMGSIAMDKAGDMALGYSVSSGSIHPEIHYTGRLPGDALNTMEAEAVIIDGTGSQTSGLSRWGDYSSMSVDPLDDCTFWYTTEYLTTNGTFNWHTRIASFKFPSCGAGPAVSLSPTSLTFGNQSVGTTSAAQTITLTNTGSATLNITSIAVTGTNSADFVQTNTCGTLPASFSSGAGCSFSVTFGPTATGPRTAAITITDDAADSPQSATLTGTGVSGGAAVTLSPTSLTFGNQSVGTTSGTQTITLTNTGGATLTITSIAVTGTNSGDFVQTNTCGASVNAGAGCMITVSFTPTGTGTRTGAVTFTDNAPDTPQSAPLTGTGIAPTATVSPASLNFPAEPIGVTSSPKNVTLTDSSTNGAVLVVTNLTITGDFAVSSNGCTSSVAQGSSCTISITFTAAGFGKRTGTLTITDNATNSPQTVSLTGTGPDFSISASPTSLTVTRGQSGTSTITVTPKQGFNQTVTLTCTGAPKNSTCTISPGSVTLDGTNAQTATLTISTTATTPTGTFNLNAKGTFSTLTHAVKITLTVQ